MRNILLIFFGLNAVLKCEVLYGVNDNINDDND